MYFVEDIARASVKEGFYPEGNIRERADRQGSRVTSVIDLSNDTIFAGK